MRPPRRILVVDDDSTLRETLGEVLRDEGYEVRLARDGAAALGQLEGWRADLIILDIMMPVMDAYAFRMVQMARHGADSAPLVVVSAVPNLDDAAERLQASAVIAKPFRLATLLETVQRVLGGDIAWERAR